MQNETPAIHNLNIKTDKPALIGRSGLAQKTNDSLITPTAINPSKCNQLAGLEMPEQT